jgi:hypothetical protein
MPGLPSLSPATQGIDVTCRFIFCWEQRRFAMRLRPLHRDDSESFGDDQHAKPRDAVKSPKGLHIWAPMLRFASPTPAVSALRHRTDRHRHRGWRQ